MENNDRLKRAVKTKIAISQFKEENMAMKINKKYIIKTISVACACLILTSGIVFAKDIERIVKNLFSNSTEAIEQAVENGYVQEVTQNFVYDKEIGVKVDNLVLDDMSLNVSFKFESIRENLEYIRLNKFIILTDTGEKIFDNDQQYVTDINDVYTASSMTWSNMPQKVAENVFSDSILFTMGERSREKNELYFRIESLDIVYKDGSEEELEGKWDIDIKITEKMKNNQTVEYKFLGSNEYLEDAKALLYPTGLELELNLKEPFYFNEYLCNEDIKKIGFTMFYLKSNDKMVEASRIEPDNELKIYTMRYDTISVLSNVPEKIEIYVEPWDDTITMVKINK